MVKRTSMNLDMDLVNDASEVLGTERTTDTVHEALREIVRRERLRRLARHDFPDLTLEAIEEMRKPRTFKWS
jgi:Arc/MetJ family transcription regulator